MRETRVHATVAMLALLVLATDTSAGAALRPEQRECQAGVARAAEQFVKKTAAARAACGDRVSKGQLFRR